ncbi:hypothetical protein [Halocatena marina]|uniref:hypothetical protein n=1 Tax=Halocatena marina TaxID=2934937 RepID=UPI00200D7C91|nr:hypothetical protein [Halocatena marina]
MTLADKMVPSGSTPPSVTELDGLGCASFVFGTIAPLHRSFSALLTILFDRLLIASDLFAILVT